MFESKACDVTFDVTFIGDSMLKIRAVERFRRNILAKEASVSQVNHHDIFRLEIRNGTSNRVADHLHALAGE